MRNFDGAIEDLRSTLCPLVIKSLETLDNSNGSAEVLNLNTKRLWLAGIVLQQKFEVGCFPPLSRRRLNPLEIGRRARITRRSRTPRQERPSGRSNSPRLDARASPSRSQVRLLIASSGLSMIARYLQSRLSHHSSIQRLVSSNWRMKLSGRDPLRRASISSPRTLLRHGSPARDFTNFFFGHLFEFRQLTDGSRSATQPL